MNQKLEKCYRYVVCGFCGDYVHKELLGNHIRYRHKAVANKLHLTKEADGQ